MQERTSYEDVMDELKKMAYALRAFDPKVEDVFGKAPILAELKFRKDKNNLSVRLIDQDNGMWSFSIIRPNSRGIIMAQIAFWTGPETKQKQLAFCPGCGTQSSQGCRHAAYFQAHWIPPENLPSRLRAEAISRLQAAP